MVGVSSFSGGVGAAIAGGKAEDILFGIVQGAMVEMLNHAAGEKQQKTFETMLREKLQQIKIGQSISVDELKRIGLVGTKESLAFNSIKRVSNSRFTVDRTFVGRAFISDDAYFDINVNGPCSA